MLQPRRLRRTNATGSERGPCGEAPSEHARRDAGCVAYIWAMEEVPVRDAMILQCGPVGNSHELKKLFESEATLAKTLWHSVAQ